jgi:hypothetical protein
MLISRWYYSVLYKIPGPPGHPLLGALPMFLGRMKVGGPCALLDLNVELMEKYGDLYTTWGPFDCSVTACGPESTREVLKILDPPKGLIYGFLRPWLGWSLLTS